MVYQPQLTSLLLCWIQEDDITACFEREQAVVTQEWYVSGETICALILPPMSRRQIPRDPLTYKNKCVARFYGLKSIRAQ